MTYPATYWVKSRDASASKKKCGYEYYIQIKIQEKNILQLMPVLHHMFLDALASLDFTLVGEPAIHSFGF